MKELKMVSKSVCVIVLILVLFSTCGFFNNKGRFVTLDLTSTDGNQPVKINNNEVFFAGGLEGMGFHEPIPAKIYNVDTKSMISLGVTMNYPRSGYGAIKYNENNILIVGGFCAYNKYGKDLDCSKLAEIYDIKEKKFTRISDTNLSYKSNINTILLKDGRVFIYSDGMFEIFKPQNKSFSLISKVKKSLYKSTSGNTILQNKYTNNKFLISRAILLDENEILILGELAGNYATKMEILNVNTGEITDIPIDKGFLSYSAVKISDGSVLSFGLGKDRNQINRFDPKERKIYYMQQAPKALIGSALLLDDGTIFVGYGTINSGDIFYPGTSLIYAIYDYRNNKIYNYKISHKDFYRPYLIPMQGKLLIIGYENTKSMLYKY
mgnify:CR=1 FL=1